MKIKSLIAAIAATASLATSAKAETYRFASWLPPSSLLAVHLYEEFAPDVAQRTGNNVQFQLFHGGSLLAAPSIMEGVADGIAQAGSHSTAYTPSANPVSQVLMGMAVRNPDPMVLVFAYADFVMNSPIGYGEFRGNGVIPVGSYGSPQNYLLCRGQIRTLDDLAGKKIRTAGATQNAIINDLGAINVSMPMTEVYTAFGYGNVDCTVNDSTWLVVALKLAEVVDSVTMLELPPLFAIPAYIYNPGFWAGLTDDDRRAILGSTAQAMARAQVNYQRVADDAIAQSRDMGVEIIEPDASLTDALAQWSAKSNVELGSLATVSSDVPNIEDVVTDFQGYMEKWDEILSATDTSDVDAVTAALNENLFDKIDVAKYGMQ